jgi:hypothetical protein
LGKGVPRGFYLAVSRSGRVKPLWMEPRIEKTLVFPTFSGVHA